jgi:hypothetical protein
MCVTKLSCVFVVILLKRKEHLDQAREITLKDGKDRSKNEDNRNTRKDA